jgi:ABC-type Fe3+-citrate transport system substrate-binding protein
MTKLNLSIVVLFAMLLAVSCSKKVDPKLQEAFSVHLKAVAASGEVKTMLGSADELIGKIQTAISGIADTDTAQAANMMKMTSAITQLQSFRPNFEQWEESLVEVPGVEHKHDHADGSHEHKPIPEHVKNMTPDQILGLQKNLLVEVEGLKGALEMTIKSAQELLQ